MNKFFLNLFIATFLFSFYSCKKKGCTDPSAQNYNQSAQLNDGSCNYDSSFNLSIGFDHYYNFSLLTQGDFEILQYINSAGNVHSLTKLQYLISNVCLYTPSGDSIEIKGYKLIDLNNPSTLDYSLDNTSLQSGSYTGMGFTFGFIEAENISGSYTDLNSASWSWPEMFGGGYHFMKMEGRFIDTNIDTTSFTYHMGTAREIILNDTVFHDNTIHIKIDTSFNLTNNARIDLKVNLDEWFKNPNIWDLNQYNSMLMANYNAQRMMQENGATVFTWGGITP